MPSHDFTRQPHVIPLQEGGELALQDMGDDRYRLTIDTDRLYVSVPLTHVDLKGIRDATGMVVMDNLIDALGPAA